MSIDKMQKMNHMIRELKKHGFANSSIDALNKVEKIYDSPNTGEMHTEKEKRFMQESKPEVEEDDEVIQFLRSFDRFKNTTSKHIDLLTEEIKNIVAKMNEIIAVVKKLEQRPVYRPAQQNPSNQPSTVSNNQPAADQNQPSQNQQSQNDSSQNSDKASHPRSGRMEPGDVDLKKHFYFGR